MSMATAVTRDTPRRRPRALLRRTGTVSYQTDAPEVFCTFLSAQGWTLASVDVQRHVTHFIGEHLWYDEMSVFDSGLIIAKGEQVIQFLNSIVEWTGGRDE